MQMFILACTALSTHPALDCFLPSPYKGANSSQLYLPAGGNPGFNTDTGPLAMLAVGFAANHTGVQLRLTADIQNLTLPAPTSLPSYFGFTSRFAVLRIDTVEQLLVQDSVFANLRNTMTVLTFYDCSMLSDSPDGSAFSLSICLGPTGGNNGPPPNITIANTSFSDLDTLLGAFNIPRALSSVPTLGNLTISATNFTHASSHISRGGAITIEAQSAPPAVPVAIVGCRFIGNSALSTSPAMDFSAASDAKPSGALSVSGMSLYVSGSTFADNACATSGGAVSVYTETYPLLSVRLAASIFSGNSAGSSCVDGVGCSSDNFQGGAVMISDSVALRISDCVFSSNQLVAGQRGGAGERTPWDAHHLGRREGQPGGWGLQRPSYPAGLTRSYQGNHS